MNLALAVSVVVVILDLVLAVMLVDLHARRPGARRFISTRGCRHHDAQGGVPA